MNQQTIRPYEMSLWTLQDSFITILKPIGGLFQGQIITPKISLKNDNTQILSFSIPMYYRNDKGELVENPLWYNTTNGNLLVNLRKIKVIFNKGEKGESVYEFIIHKITESHSNGQLICEVEAEGLAFQELGKIGYKITLNYDEFLLDIEKDENLLASLNYWLKKIFKNTNWTYSIQMDWSSYDGIIDLAENGNVIDYESLTNEEKNILNDDREARGLRRRDTIYEEEYISSWYVDEETKKLVPRELIQFQEKARIPQIEKSNIYNITQDLAELFELYCKYKYHYDDNYHIIGRECIFYNNFLDEVAGKFDINYPYHTNDIKRTLESTDIVTKMYVVPLEDISIVDVSANKSKEDYILNFDYLYSIGTISQEQYDAIEDYNYNTHLLNTNYENLVFKKNELDIEINDLKSNYKFLSNAIIYDEEQISKAEEGIRGIPNNGIINRTDKAPEKVVLIKEDSNYKINLSLEGLIENDVSKPVKIYLDYDSFGVKGNPITKERFSFNYDTDTGKNIIGITKIKLIEEEQEILEEKGNSLAYLVGSFDPMLKYDNIIKVFKEKLKKDGEDFFEVEQRLKEIGIVYIDEVFEIEEDSFYDKILKELDMLQLSLENTRADFERMMGPALREGSWQAEEDYSDYGDKYSIEDLFFEKTAEKARAFWDKELFDEEINYYYEEGIELKKIYYPAIDITNIYSALNEVEDNLVLEYKILISEGSNDGSNQGQNSVEAKYENVYLRIHSQFEYAFFKETETDKVIPIFLITEEFTEKSLQSLKETGSFGTLQYDEDGETIFTKIEDISLNFIDVEENEDKETNYYIVYPRIEIQSDKLKTSDEELTIYQNKSVEENKPLEKYSHYTLLGRNSWYYITIKPRYFMNKTLIEEKKEILEDGSEIINNIVNLKNNKYQIDFVLSNAALRLYLDALEVSKVNAYPQASYEVSVATLSPDFLKYTYKKLNKVANINDDELKFENVQGYISEINLNLDNPSQDSFVIQNYKTKFEDLFSRIVASSEQMQANQTAYDRAAASFTNGGFLSPSVIQSSINQTDLKYSFNQGTLSIDEVNGIWATSDAGVVAMRGGGIFCATERDSNNNWLWNTGITPSGINASLLQAGTIDTNLIRIYSGDNVRFQMNANGLFAYEETEDGKTNFDKYVVHNSEGLFLTENNVEEYEDENGEKQTSVDLVEISWDGLILRNKKGETVFNADRETGDLTIVGHFEANTGKIGGWSITEKGLEGKNEIKDEDGNTILSSEAGIILKTESSAPYNMLYVNGSGENSGSFAVKSDGTLYATNAYFSGKVAAGSYIENMSTTDALAAIKRLNLINFYGNSFNYSNPNLDGNIVLERDWLSFACQQIGINCYKWEIYKVENKADENLGIEENKIKYYSSWETNESGKHYFNDADKFLSVDIVNDLTFNIKSDILTLDKTIEANDAITLKIIGIAQEYDLDEYGKVNFSSLKDVEYELYFIIYNSKKDLNKHISLFTPPSYSFTTPTTLDFQKEDLRVSEIHKLNIEGITLQEKFGTKFFDGDNFIENEEGLIYYSKQEFIVFLTSLELDKELLERVESIEVAAELNIENEEGLSLAEEIIQYLNNSIALKWTQDFSLILTNLLPLEENVVADTKEETGIITLNGNSDVTDTSISVEDSSIFLIPSEELNEGKWEINGEIVLDGDSLEGNNYNFNVFYEKISDTETKIIFRIGYEEIPEGEEILLRYTFGTAERTCNIFRPKNGIDSIVTVIESSEGTIFKNGNIETTLTVSVYEGSTLLNGDTSTYGYLWFKNNTLILEDGVDLDSNNCKYLNKKVIEKITDEDVQNKAYYSVQVYNTQKEAIDEYKKIAWQ